MKRRPRLPVLVLLPLVSLVAGSCGSSNDQPQPVPDPLVRAFDSRKQEYLDFCLDSGGSGLATQLVRLERARGPLDAAAFEGAFAQITDRRDCSDFSMAVLIRILYQYRDSPLLSSELRGQIEDVVQGFKYWIDEKLEGEEKPVADQMVYWSENHQILFHSEEYLAGQLFPDQPFPNSGRNGRWHVDKAAPMLRKWLDFRARVGFSEWHSNVYYEEDLSALLNLADFARDPDIAQKAAMVADLLLFDIGLHTSQGNFGSTHGRSYEKDKLSGRNDDTACVARILWGEAVFNSNSSNAAVSLAVSPRYRPPPALLYVGRDRTAGWADRERMGVSLEDAAQYGLTFDDFDSGIFWWGMGAYAASQVIELSFRMAEAWNLWENEFWKYFKPLQCLLPLGLLPDLSTALYPFSDGSVLGEVNTYTYRTGDYMLSSVQDHLPGYVAFQQHIWQATLGLDAVAFSTHPGTIPEDIEMIGYWTGGSSMPRVGQYRNVLVAVFNPIIGSLLTDFTHAWFPQDAYDEVIREGSWVFGRKGDGYIALYSHLPMDWATEGAYADRELIAPGTQNIWICEMGSKAANGSFTTFRQSILQAAVTVDGLAVSRETIPRQPGRDCGLSKGGGRRELPQDEGAGSSHLKAPEDEGCSPGRKQNGLALRYDSPSQGEIRFGWEGPLLVQGAPVDLAGYPRYDNPYCQTNRGELAYRIQAGGYGLFLDFEQGSRRLLP